MKLKDIHYEQLTTSWTTALTGIALISSSGLPVYFLAIRKFNPLKIIENLIRTEQPQNKQITLKLNEMVKTLHIQKGKGIAKLSLYNQATKRIKTSMMRNRKFPSSKESLWPQKMIKSTHDTDSYHTYH